MLKVGTVAPNFNLPNSSGELINLNDFIGKKVVVYFYPKDNTSGCTTQALEFKEHYNEFLSKGMVVIGISKDSPKSHQKFIDNRVQNVFDEYDVMGWDNSITDAPVKKKLYHNSNCDRTETVVAWRNLPEPYKVK